MPASPAAGLTLPQAVLLLQPGPAMVVAFDFDCTDFEVVNFGKLGLAAGLLGRPAAFGSGINPYE